MRPEIAQAKGECFVEQGIPRERGRELGRLLIDTAIDLERKMIPKEDD